MRASGEIRVRSVEYHAPPGRHGAPRRREDVMAKLARVAKATVATRGDRPRISMGFVFRSVFQDRPDLCAELLEVCLGIEVREVSVVEHERVVEADMEARAGRLDLYVVGADGTRYDVEVQVEGRKNELLRARYYQSLMDVDFLKRGGDVMSLPQTMVLFICDFDPFGADLRRYDCVTTVQQTGKEAGDGRRIVMLNAGALDGHVSPELDAFLRFFRNEAVEGDPFVDKIEAIIDSLLLNPTWKEQYMTFEDELEAARWNAERRGMEKERTRAEHENALLVEALEAAGRAGELGAAFKDPTRRAALIAEFGIDASAESE